MIRKLFDLILILSVVGLATWNYRLQEKTDRTRTLLAETMFYAAELRIEMTDEFLTREGLEDSQDWHLRAYHGAGDEE